MEMSNGRIDLVFTIPHKSSNSGWKNETNSSYEAELDVVSSQSITRHENGIRKIICS